NSLGGAVILQAVIDGTIHSEAIILAGSGAKLGVPGHLRTLLEEDFETAVDYLHSDNNLFYDESHPAVAVSKQAMHATGQQVTQRDFLTCHTFDVRDELNESMPPLLALTGEYDELTPPRFHDYLANETGGSSTTIANAAHLSMLEQPNAFNRAIKSFLQAI
ncbi:MAG: alpha/beta fold hydrolase, partial [Halobacteriaceae archaeon]